MNKIQIIGNLTRDAESASTQSGKVYSRFTVAVNRSYTNDDGTRPCDYFNVVAWNKLAERCAKYLFKGNKVGISGEMQMRKYTDRYGVERTVWELVANEVDFLTPKSAQDDGQRGNVPQDMTPVYNEDLPF